MKQFEAVHYTECGITGKQILCVIDSKSRRKVQWSEQFGWTNTFDSREKADAAVVAFNNNPVGVSIE